MSDHPLLELMRKAASGHFPAADGSVTVLPALRGGLEAAVAFTAHAVIATDLPPDQVLALGPDGYGGAMAPDFLRALAGAGWIGVLDATLARRGTGGGGLPTRDDLDEHPRVQHARMLREDVTVYGDERGLITLGRGLAGRQELSIEVFRPGAGGGAALLADGLALVPPGEIVFAAAAPGNARSLRLLLRAGFTPIASEVQLRPARPGSAGQD